MPSFKEDHKSVLDWLKTQVKKSGAKVMMNTEENTKSTSLKKWVHKERKTVL